MSDSVSDITSDITDVSEIPPSTTTISTVAVQAGKSRVVLAILRSGEWIQVRVHQMEPDIMDIGTNLEEARQLHQEHIGLLSQLKAKEDEIKELLAKADTNVADRGESQRDVCAAMAETLGEAWKDLNAKLEYRGKLLEQSVAFHTTANEFGNQLEKALNTCINVPLANDVEHAQNLLQQHQELKKGILESSKQTLDLGHELLDKIRKMGMHADQQNRHATTAACYGIEHLLELLHDRRRHLEELWAQRKLQLEQCLQLCLLDQEVNKILEWYRTVGEAYLQRTELGVSVENAQNELDNYHKYEKEGITIQDNVLKLVRTADQLLRRTNLDAEGVRQRLQAVDETSENFMIKLDNRRKNIAMALSFFKQAEAALTKLGQIEVQLNTMDLPRNSTALAEESAKLSNAIVESTTEALHEGRILLERVGREDSGANGVRQKYAELQECCARVESICKARQADAWEKNQAYLNFQEKYKNLQAWLTQIGLATLSRHKDLGSSLANSKDFLEIHQQLLEEVRGKETEMQSLSEAAANLVMSGNQEGPAAKDMSEALHHQWFHIQKIITIRIELSLIFVSFHKITHNLASSTGSFENILRSETDDLQDITEDAVKNLQGMWSQTLQIHKELQELGNTFLQKSSTVKDDSDLDVAKSVTLVEKMLNEYRYHMVSLTERWEIWQQRVSSSQQFKVQWHQFIQDARKTIDWIMSVEQELFMPYISGHLGENKQTTEELQKKLEDYGPIVKEAEEKIKVHLKTAEELASKGDTKGQKDQIINELVKVHQRFQARITEYQILLKLTIQFFGSLHQLDELINRTEKEYTTAELPSDLNQAERMLEEHKMKKSEVNQLLTFTADEGEKIVVRVRQQGADAAAQDEVRRVMEISENYKRRWNQTWEEHDRRLAQNLQICQFNFDLRQIHSEIDELHHHLQARRGNYGNNLPAARMTSQAFKQFEMTVELIEKKINSFISTAELMVQDKHYDSVHIHEEIDVLKKKWSTFHTSVTDYRTLLDISVMYFQMIEETEQWIRDGNQMLINIGRQATECQQASDAITLILKLQKFVDAEKAIMEEKINKISELSVQLYGDQGVSKVRHVVVAHQDLMQSFQQADNELSALKQKLEGGEAMPVDEHIPMQVDIPVNEQGPSMKPPRITQHLKNAEVLEGSKFTFECHIESEVIPEVKWFKDSLPLTSPDYETCFANGVATLTIEETFSEDTARYTCRVSNEVGAVESSAQLIVKETHQQIIPPDFTKNLKSADVLEGSPFTFECHMTGMPSPDISWYKDDQNIDNSPDFVITQINGTCCLKLRKASLNESARYTCRAINAGGEAASSARLTIKPLEKPVIHEPLADQTTTEGKGVRLRVVYTGVPTPDVSWFKGTEEIVTSNVFKISTEHNFSILDVMEAYPEDSGTYSAVIQNVAGEAKTSCQVNIETAYSSAGEDTSQTSTDVEPLKPYFSQLLKTNYEAAEGTSVRLDCIIVGQPEPEVIWYHNEKPVKESKDIQLQFLGDRCTLVIREVLLEDSGIYKCVACNLHGVAESQCLLHVEALSEMSDTSAGELSPPVFPELLNDIVCNAGDKIILKCQVQGNPPPVVQWFKEGILIEPSADYQITCENDVHLLTIPEAFAEDNGTFMVNAVNPAGEAKCYAKIIIKNETNKPGADKVTMVRRRVEKVTKVIRTEEIKQAPPEFTKLFQDLTVKLGEPVTLECIITGTPKPKVSWQFNGENIYSTPYQATMEGDKYRLVINQVSESDAGRFSITAENPSGRATCSARLVVEKAAPAPAPVQVPVIPMETQYTHTVTQSETRLSRIIADMQDKNYAEMERHSTTITTQIPPKFEVKGPAVATQDRFATSITTDVAPQYQQVDLTIEVPIPPKFLQALKNITALEGTKVTFDGVVTGKPEPSIKWYKKDKEITDAADFEISYKDGRVSLTIPEAIEEHSGQVTCTASNYVGTASSTAELIVKASMIPPSFTERLQKRQVKEGEAVKLTVRVAGTPAPQVMWYREGSHIVSSPDFEIIQEGDIHTLYIPEVFYEDSGKFTVKAKNPAGEASCCAELRVKAPAVESVAQIEISKKADIYMQPVKPPAPVTEPVLPQMQKPSAYSPSPIRHVQAPVPKPVQSPIPKPVPSPVPSPKPVEQPLIKPMKAPVPKAPAPQPVQPPIIKPVQAPVKTEVVMEIEGEEPVLPPFEKRIKLFDQPTEESPITKNVHTKPQSKPVPREKPSFSTTLRDIHVGEGEKVVLEVVITGRPEPTIKWFREDNLLNSTPDFEITYANGISRLVIAEVFPEDSGKYACIASNMEGSCTATAYLNVKPAPSSSGSASPMSASRSSTRISPVVAAAAAEPVSMSPVAPAPILGFRKVPFKVPSPGPQPAAPQAPPPPPPESPIMPSQRPPVTKPAKPANQPPKFIEKLQNATIIEGTNVMMECKVTGVPFPHIMWTRMGLPVMEDERHKIHVDSVTGRCSFLVAKCAIEDKGIYTCSAQNIAGQDTTTASLVAAQPEKVQPLHQPETRLDTKKPPPHEFYIPRPERVLAERAEDRPTHAPDFKSSAFEDRLKKEIQFRDGKIHGIGDTGSTSEYDSEHPEDKVSFVKEFPKITQTLKDFKLIEGSDATFVCKVSGKPRPKIAWYKDGKRVKRSKHAEMKYTHDGYCTLKIKNALREDAGCYTVFAVNSSGRDTCSAELCLDVKGIDRSSFVEPETLERMLRRDKEKPQDSGKGGVFEVCSKPVFQKIPESQDVREGQTVRFDCYVTGRPYPEITWYKNDVELFTDDLHKVVVNENGIHSVIILSATSQDAGQYKCVARNKGGMATFTISLDVSERQQVHPPQFIERLQSFTIKETNSATLSCAAVGFPLPMMSWQKDGKMLSNKEYKITIDGGRSTLTIENATLDDSAWFQCSAVNVSGSASTRAKLTVIGTGPSHVEPPEKPMFGVMRKDSPPKYDIQPEGPVQQISYATEHDSATLKLMREDDIASAPTVASSKPTRARGKVPAVLPKPEEAVQPSDETDFKQPLISQAKMLFDPTGKPLPPPATLPKESVAPSTMPVYATAKHVAAPTPTIAPSQAPVSAAPTVGRGDSPPSYELQEEGPVQQISYASEIGSAVLKIVEQVDIKRDDGKQVTEPLPVSEKTEPSKVAPVAAPKPALKPVKKPVETPVTKPVPPPAPVTKPVPPPAPILKPVSAPVSKAPRRPKPIERKLSPEEVRDHPVAIQQGKTVWSSETSEVYKALMEQSLESTDLESRSLDMSAVSIQKETERQLEKIAKESHGRRSSIHPTEDMFQKSVQKMPQFKTKLKGTRVLEYERTHLECILTPINDPTMKVEWFKDGEPLLHGHRFRPCYEFGYVVLDLLFTIPEDSGVYSIVATNVNGQVTTSAEVICDSKTSIIIGTQLPEGQQTMERLRQLDQYRKFSLMVGNFAEDDVPVEPSPPSIEVKPEPVEIDEGETAKFIVNVSGYPRPRVTWWINGSLVVAGSRFRVRYDGMIHYLEIPRVREYDTGQIRIFAKNQQGEAEAITVLKVIPKEDWRSRLRHAPQEDLQVELERRKRVELRSAELKTAQVKSTLSAFELSMLTHESTFRKDTSDVHLQKLLVEEEEERKKRQTFTTTKQIEFIEKEISEPSHLPATKEEPPVFITPLCPTKVPEGKPVSLEVKFSGNPPPILTWYRDDFEIHSSWDFQIRITETSSTLHISEAFPEDTGMYTVKAYNKYGMTQCKAKLTVLEEVDTVREVSPEFRNLLRDTKVVVGEPATFDCEVTGKPKPEVYWQKNGKNMPESPRWKFIHEDNHYTLLIFEVQPEDAGTYACVSINASGKSTCTAKLLVDETLVKKESHASLKLAKKIQVKIPSVLEVPENRTVPESESVTFRCKIVGTPAPIVSWYYNNHLVKPSKYFKMTSTQDGVHTLTLLEAFPEDSGQYRCVARNKAGETSCVCNLVVVGMESEPEPAAPETVVQPPSFIKPISNIVIDEGSPTCFEAIFAGVPEPEITWLRNGEPIQNTRDFKIDRVGNMTLLAIKEAFPEDSGLITCRARNCAGVAECSAEFYVQEEQEQPDDKVSKTGIRLVQPKLPVFRRSLPQTYKVKVGQTARLEAQIDAYPPPLTKWYVNGVEIVTSEHYQMIQEGNTVVLIIFRITKQDAGEYILRVGNELGEATCRTTIVIEGKKKEVSVPDVPETVTVKMIEKQEKTVTTQIRKVKPVFVEPIQREICIRERGIARLECTVEAHPPPVITWYINGMEIKPSPHYEMFYESGKSLLLIIDVGPEDTGEYTCRAVSEIGEAMCSTTLYVQEPAMAEMSPPPEDLTQVEPSPAEKVYPPYFVENLQSTQVFDGHAIKLICRVEGKPIPKISWFHNGTNIDNNDEYVISYNPDTGCVCLHIVEALPEDQGTYVCKATNLAGQATTSATLTVLVPTKETVTAVRREATETTTETYTDEMIRLVDERYLTRVEMSPQYTLPKDVQEGRPVRLICKLTGKPNVSWYINEVEIQPSSNRRMYTEHNTSILLIVCASYEDTGEYVCRVENKEGVSISKASLNVMKQIEAPLQETSSPDFTQLLQPQTVRDGERVEFKVRFTGVPRPRITWFHNGSVIQSTNDIKIIIDYERGESMLIIVEIFPEDEGEYTCSASNEYGEIITTCKLTVISYEYVPDSEEASSQEAPSPKPALDEVDLKPLTYEEVKQLVKEEQSQAQVFAETVEVNVAQKREQVLSKSVITEISKQVESAMVIQKQPEITTQMRRVAQETQRPDEGFPKLSKILPLQEVTETATTSLLKEHVQEMTTTQEIAKIQETHERKYGQESKVSEIEAVLEQPNVIQIAGKSEQKLSTIEIKPLKEEVSQIATHHERSISKTALSEELTQEERIADIKLLTTESGAITSVPFESLQAECKDAPQILETLEMPKFETELRNISVVENNVLHLEVFVSGATVPIKWYMDNVELGPSPGVIIREEGGHSEYIIEECYPEDEGRYTAVATNKFGTVKSSANITIQSPPGPEIQKGDSFESEDTFEECIEPVISDDTDDFEECIQDVESKVTTEQHIDKDVVIHKVGYSLKGLDSTQFKSEIVMSPELEKQEIHFAVSPETVVQEEICMSERSEEIPYTDTITLEVDKQKEEIVKMEFSTDVLADSSFKNVLMLEPTNIMVAIDEVDAATKEKAQIYLAEEGKEIIDEESSSDFKIGSDIIEAQISENLAVEKSEIMKQKEVCSEQIPESLNEEYSIDLSREASPLEVALEIIKPTDEHHKFVEQETQKVEQIPEELAEENIDLFPREPSPIEPTPEVVESKGVEQYGVMEKGIQKVDMLPEDLEAEHTDLFPREPSPIESTPEVVESKGVEQYGVMEKGIQKVDQVPEELEAEMTDVFKKEPSPIEPAPEVVKPEDTEQHSVTEKGVQKVDQVPEELEAENTDLFPREPSPIEPTPEVVKHEDTEQHGVTEKGIQKVDQVPEELEAENTDLFPREPSPIEPTPEVVKHEDTEQHGVTEKGVQKVDQVPEELEAENTELFPREPSPIESTPEVVKHEDTEQHGVTEKGVQKVDQVPEELEAENTELFPREPSPIEPTPEVVKHEDTEQHDVTEKGVQKVDQVPEELEAENTDLFPREPSPIEPTPELVQHEDTEQHGVTEKGIQKVDQVPEELEAENTDVFPREPSPIEPTPEVVKHKDTEQHDVTEKGVQKVDQVPEELEAENTDLFPREPSPIEPTPEVVKHEDTEQHDVTEKGVQKVDQIPEELEAENTDLFPREPSPIEPTPEVVKSEDTEQHGVTEKGVQKVDQVPEELEAENTDLFPREPSPIEPTPEVVPSEDIERHGITDKEVQKVDQIPEDLKAESTELVQREPSPTEPIRDITKSEDTEHHDVTEKGVQKVDQIPEILKEEDTELFPRETSPIEPATDVVQSLCTEQIDSSEQQEINVDHVSEDMILEILAVVPREESPTKPSEEFDQSESVKEHISVDITEIKVDAIAGDVESETLQTVIKELNPITPMSEIVKSPSTEILAISQGSICTEELPETTEMDRLLIVPKEHSPGLAELVIDDSSEIVIAAVEETTIKMAPEEIEEFEDAYEASSESSEDFAECEVYVDVQKVERGISVSEVQKHDITLAEHVPVVMEIEEQFKSELNIQPERRVKSNIDINVNEVTHHDIAIVEPTRKTEQIQIVSAESVQKVSEKVQLDICLEKKETKVTEVAAKTTYKQTAEVAPKTKLEEVHLEIEPSKEIEITKKETVVKEIVTKEEKPVEETSVFREGLEIAPKPVFEEVHFEIKPQPEISVTRKEKIVEEVISKEEETYAEQTPVFKEGVKITPKKVFKEVHFEIEPEKEIEITKKEKVVQEIVTKEEEKPVEETVIFREAVEIAPKPVFEEVHFQIAPEKEIEITKKDKVVQEIVTKEEEKSVEETAVFREGLEIAPKPVFEEVHFEIAPQKKIEITKKEKVIKEIVTKEEEKPVEETAMFREGLEIAPKPVFEEVHFEIAPQKEIEITKKEKVIQEIVTKEEEKPVEETAVFREGLEIAPKPVFEEVHFQIAPEKEIEITKKEKVVKTIVTKEEAGVPTTGLFKEGISFDTKPTFEEVQLDLSLDAILTENITREVVSIEEITDRDVSVSSSQAYTVTESDVKEVESEVVKSPDVFEIKQRETISIETIDKLPLEKPTKEPEPATFEKEIKFTRKPPIEGVQLDISVSEPSITVVKKEVVTESQSIVVSEEVLSADKPREIQEKLPVVEVSTKYKETIRLNIVKDFNDICTWAGDRFTLEIVFDAYPAPRISWFFEDEPIESTEEFKIVIEETRTMIIVKQAILEDEGEYRVKIENEAGSLISTAYVTVLPSAGTDSDFQVQKSVVSEQQKKEIKEEFQKLEVSVDVKREHKKSESPPVAEVSPLITKTETTIITEETTQTITDRRVDKETTQTAPSEGGVPAQFEDSSMQTFLLTMIMAMMLIRFMAWLLSFGCCFWCCFFCCLWQ